MSARPLSLLDLDTAMPLMVDAFGADPQFRYIVPDDAEWQQVAARYFRLALQRAVVHGHGLIEKSGHAVSLWEPPLSSQSGTRPFEQLAELMRLALILRRNLGRALSIQRFTAGFRPRRPHWHLSYLASAPGHQGKGYGTGVLQPMLDFTNASGQPIYLECSNRTNIGFYVRHGFNIVAEVKVSPNHCVWPMLREPATV